MASTIGLGGISAAGEKPRTQILSKDPEKSLEKAKDWLNKGKYQNALDLLTPFVSNPNKYPEHYSDYMVIMFWAGYPNKAISMFESMPVGVPRRPYLLRNMAKAYYDKGNFNKAIQLYKEALSSFPGDFQTQKGLVVTLVEDNRFQEAQYFLDRFIEKTSDSLELQLVQPIIYFNQKQYLKTLNAYGKIIDQFPGNISEIENTRDDMFLSLTEEGKILFLGYLRNKAELGHQDATLDLVHFSSRFSNYAESVKIFEVSEISADSLSGHRIFWLAWAHFKTGKTDAAHSLFKILNKRGTHELLSNTGLAYCLADKKKYEPAHVLLDQLGPEYSGNLQVLYARAFVYEKEERYWDAVQIYDEMLAISPENVSVRRLRLRAFSDMGASYYAYNKAKKVFPDLKSFLDSFLSDNGLDYVKWGEPEEAVKVFESFIDSGSDPRFIYDYLVALTEAEYHNTAVACYETLQRGSIDIPPWLHEKVGESYLYLEKPEKALKHYDKTIAAFPDSYTALFGKFYTLQELRRWDEAEELLDEMAAIFPKIISHEYNPQQLEIDIARGWLLAYENRLREADQYFQSMYEAVPGNIEVRNGLSHVHLWRGWDRMALEEFNTMESMDPDYIWGRPARSLALNSLAFKEEARNEAHRSNDAYPRNKRFNRLLRKYEIEEMNEFYARVETSVEEDETYDILFETGASTPLSLYTRMYAFLLWRRTWTESPTDEQEALGDDVPTYFRRTGIGVDHIFNDTWNIRQQFSVDVDDGGEFGSYTRVNFTPDDYWRLGASYDSFAFDVPKRARASDVTAQKAAADAVYRESEWRQYSLSGSRQWFSDDNIRDEMILGYDQNLWVKRDWRQRIFTDLYYTQNSNSDDPFITYYNPESAWGLSLTLMTEQVVKSLYERIFYQRLYVTMGTYDQQNYSMAPTGSVRYEQEHNFTDVHYMLWGVSLGQNVYDGDAVNALNFDIIYIWRF